MNGRHKYNVGDKFDFGGIVEILCRVRLEGPCIPKYLVRLPSGKRMIYNEELLDSLLALYSYDSRGDVYIPAPSRELKIDSDCGAGEAINAINDATPDIISFDNPMDRQVNVKHYEIPIRTVEFIERNGLGFCVGNCIEYLCRYKRKNGREDLEKARHYIDLLIELEYPEDEKD